MGSYHFILTLVSIFILNSCQQTFNDHLELISKDTNLVQVDSNQLIEIKVRHYPAPLMAILEEPGLRNNPLTAKVLEKYKDIFYFTINGTILDTNILHTGNINIREFCQFGVGQKFLLTLNKKDTVLPVLYQCEAIDMSALTFRGNLYFPRKEDYKINQLNLTLIPLGIENKMDFIFNSESIHKYN